MLIILVTTQRRTTHMWRTSRTARAIALCRPRVPLCRLVTSVSLRASDSSGWFWRRWYARGLVGWCWRRVGRSPHANRHGDFA
eukprot:6074706-Prymnesium_polylepis.1